MELNIQELLLQEKGNFYLVKARERDIDIFSHKLYSLSNKDIVEKVIRGRRCSTKESLFQEFAASLQFPYYFGHNWNAFDECITDLDWIHANKYFLFITNLDDLLSDNPNDLKIFLSLLKDAILELSEPDETRTIEHAVSLNILFHCDSLNEEKCKEILKENNIDPITKDIKPYDNMK